MLALVWVVAAVGHAALVLGVGGINEWTVITTAGLVASDLLCWAFCVWLEYRDRATCA